MATAAPPVTTSTTPRSDDLLKYVLSYSDVRAVVGLAEKELKDTVLQLGIFVATTENYLTQIYEGTIDVMERLEKKQEDSTTDPASNPPLTRKERALLGLIKVVSTYACASNVNPDMVGIKRVTDGKSEQERFANAFAKVLDNVKESLRQYTNMLRDALIAYGEDVPPKRTYYGVSSVGLGTDPVTGA